MACLTQTNKELSVELESFVTADMEVQTYLNKRDKVESIKAKAEEELRWTLADAHNRKEQAMKVSAMNQYMMTQAAMERNEQMERHAAYEKQLAMD